LPLRFKSKLVTPAIVALASKARSEENFKVINTALMEQMKSDVVAARLAAINTERELYAELTTDWAKMLPPTVPIISEIMEDEDDTVIDAAHLLIATIEKVTGISMQKLLT
jgi:U3 small nucleolar RNA-associated protein 10